MNVILLLLLLVFIGLSAFLGFRRGLLWTALRFAFFIIAAFLSALFARSLAENLIIRFLGQSTSSPTVYQLFYSLIDNSDFAGYAPVPAKPLAGLSLSAAVPIAFSVLLIIGIIVSFILYLLARLIIYKLSGSKKIRVFSIKSKCFGTILGALYAMLAFSMITASVYIPLKTVTDSGKTSELVNLAKDITDLVEDNSIARSRTIDKINSIQSFASSIVNSGAMKLADFTFATNLSEVIYTSLSTIDSDSVMKEADSAFVSQKSSTAPEHYSLIGLWEEFLPMLGNTRNLVTALNKSSIFDVKNLDLLEASVGDFCNLSLISEEDKLFLISQKIAEINHDISLLPYDTYIPRLPEYESLSAFKKDLHNFFEVLKVSVKYLE